MDQMLGCISSLKFEIAGELLISLSAWKSNSLFDPMIGTTRRETAGRKTFVDDTLKDSSQVDVIVTSTNRAKDLCCPRLDVTLTSVSRAKRQTAVEYLHRPGYLT